MSMFPVHQASSIEIFYFNTCANFAKAATLFLHANIHKHQVAGDMGHHASQVSKLTAQHP
jgi:hypothetical protein